MYVKLPENFPFLWKDWSYNNYSRKKSQKYYKMAELEFKQCGYFYVLTVLNVHWMMENIFSEN